ALKGEDFAELAQKLSDDTASAKQGGDLGYNTRGKMVTPFDDAQFAMKAGDVSPVVETRFGYHVIKVEGVREGDVPVDEAKHEIELSEDKPLPDGPIKVDDSYVVFRLMSRERATKEAFAGTEEQRLRDALVRRKRGEVLDAYVRSLRKKADSDGAVLINPAA